MPVGQVEEDLVRSYPDGSSKLLKNRSGQIQFTPAGERCFEFNIPGRLARSAPTRATTAGIGNPVFGAFFSNQLGEIP